ncbi:hypothetical protein [Hymenobacter nivis]|uniref:DUF3153 domain-containing protein n=1 Tax=Hymenobacter nivis TaxID=1850093 RepID=A0A2Z3GJR6_9BACT|nr:hypothetical protein [Hymenobacter nivis]AWM31356.1 hypothetical protein DDQ68_00275 [Hymenobacter nivis]
MKPFLFLCLLLLAAACNPLRSVLRPSPERQLSRLLTAHPELVKHDTVSVHDTVTVARVQVQTRYVAIPDRPRERGDSLQLDALLSRLGSALDTAQRKATQATIYRLVRQRPYFPDTLRFDTLGVHGRIWQRGRVYSIRLTRDEIRTPHEARAVVSRLGPGDGNRPAAWYRPGTWPRWVYLLAGFLIGLLLCFRLARR